MDETEKRRKPIVFHAEDTFSPLLWDNEDDFTEVGDTSSFYIDGKEYSLDFLRGLKEWFQKADMYDPYTDVAQFTQDGMEQWINEGYEFAKQINEILPRDVDMYYGFWHQFGDGKWRFCKAYLCKFDK